MRDEAVLVRAAAETLLERCRGVLELRFAAGAAGRPSHVASIFQQPPCRALFPRVAAGEPIAAVLLTTSGGLTGGDAIRIAIAADAGVTATVTTQAAEKIYRSLGADCTIDVMLDIGEDAYLEYLPQETILFEAARLARRCTVHLGSGGRLLAAEIVVFGRAAFGERLTRGRLLDSWRLHCGDRLVWADALRLDGDLRRLLDHPAGFAGAGAAATVIYAAEDAPRRLDAARELLDGAAGRAAASIVNGVLLARFLGPDAQALRGDVMRFCAGLRHVAAGLPGCMPRVWSI
jgi:urease accessory protein